MPGTDLALVTSGCYDRSALPRRCEARSSAPSYALAMPCFVLRKATLRPGLEQVPRRSHGESAMVACPAAGSERESRDRSLQRRAGIGLRAPYVMPGIVLCGHVSANAHPMCCPVSAYARPLRSPVCTYRMTVLHSRVWCYKPTHALCNLWY
eukprot:658507-Rhodomonas_salina.2